MAGSSPFTVKQIFLSPNSVNSGKTFRKNSNVSVVFLTDVLVGIKGNKNGNKS